MAMATNDRYFKKTNGFFEEKLKDQDKRFIDNQKGDFINDQWTTSRLYERAIGSF